MIDFFRNIKYGIRNIIKWTPLLYKDRDWDHVYLMKIIQFKMSNMEKLFRKHGHHVNSDRDAKEIRICITLLDKIIKDDYLKKEWTKFDEKWGELEFTKNELIRSKVITEEDNKQVRKETRRLYDKEDSIRNQDMDLLFKIMRRKILGWWD